MIYRKEIDGLRALAVLPVILFHGGFEWFSGGFVGVDVFFVISGYLITSIILSEKKSGIFSLAGFYERRVRRILPALFFVMACSTAIAWHWLLPDDMKQFARSELAVSFFASNILFFLTTGYFASAAELKPLLHTWSLAVEEQYYLVFPLFVMATWRHGLRVIALICGVFAVASLAIAHWGAVGYPAFTFYLLPARIWELLLGALIAIYIFSYETRNGVLWSPQPVSAQIGSMASLALILYAIFSFDRWTPFPSLYALVPTIGAAGIILYANPRTLVGKLLACGPLVGIGIISYSAYLWHQPLFAFARHRSIGEPSALLFSALSLATLILAYGTWKYVEAPFRQRGKFSRNHIVALSTVGVCMIVAFGLGGHVTGGFPSRFDANMLAMEKASQEHRERVPTCQIASGKPGILKSACSLGSPVAPIGVLVGDSHADALAVALGESLEQGQIALKDVSRPGCSPSVNMDHEAGDDASCLEYNRQVLKELATTDSFQYVVIASRWTIGLDGHGENLSSSGKNGNGFDNEEGGVEYMFRPKDTSIQAVDKEGEEIRKRILIKNRLVESVSAYLKANKKVILVYPIPEAGWNVPAHLSKIMLHDHSRLNAFDGSTSFAVYKKRNKAVSDILDSIGENKNLMRVRPAQKLCDTYLSNRCVTQINGVPLYFDDDHLSNTGARLIAKEILLQIKRPM